MEENNNNKENFQSETKEVVNEVKNAFKGTNFKDEAMNTKNFFLKFIKSPIGTVREACDNNGNNIMIAIILLAILVIANVLKYIIDYSSSDYLEVEAKYLILKILSPILFVTVFTLITYFMGGKERKSLTTIVSAIVIAITPFVVLKVIGVLYALINQALSIGFIYDMIDLTITFITMVLLMNTIKELITKTGDEEKDFRKVILIVFISYAIICVLGKLEIYSFFC